MSVRNVATDRSAEFFNRPTLRDKDGIQFDTFIKTSDEALIAALKSFVEEHDLRLSIVSPGGDPSQFVVKIDIYGDPARVAIIARSLLQRAYQVDDVTALEFIRMD